MVYKKWKLNELRKRQGYTKVERAFVAISEDPNFCNVTESFTNPSSSGDDGITSPESKAAPTIGKDELDDWMTNQRTPRTTPKSNGRSKQLDDEFSTYSELFEDYQRAQQEADHLCEDLACARTNLMQVLDDIKMEHADNHQKEDLLKESYRLAKTAKQLFEEQESLKCLS
jgi:hypothetical protein